MFMSFIRKITASCVYLFCFACAFLVLHGFHTKRVGAWLNQQGPTQASAVPPPPGEIEFPTVGSDSVSLSWGVPEGMDIRSLRFRVSWTSGTETCSLRVTDVNHMNIQSLSLGTEYIFSVATIGENNTQSQCVSAAVSTVIPAPEGLTVDSVDVTSVSLRWSRPHGLDQTPRFLVSYCCPGKDTQSISTASYSTVLSNLQPGTEYTVSVCTVLENGESEATSQTHCTGFSPPGKLNISFVDETSVSLSWDRPTDMEGVHHTFRVNWWGSRGQRESITTDENPTVLSHLRPGTEYSISVCTVLQSSGLESDPVCTTVCT
ncbi:hypothetical protein AAFF_G00076300, partial [Aldrovandia affinis]